MSCPTLPPSFNLVDEQGKPARTIACPFCRGNLTIGFVAPKVGRPDTVPTAIHGHAPDRPPETRDGLTGCATFDDLDLLNFLTVATLATALAPVPRWGHA